MTKHPESVLRHFRPYWGRIALVGLLSTLFSLFEAVGLAALLPVIEDVIGNGQPSRVTLWLQDAFEAVGIPFETTWVITFVVLLFVAKAILEYFSIYLSSTLAKAYSLHTMTAMFARYTATNWEFFSSQRVGHLLNILTEIRRIGAFVRAALSQLTHVVFSAVLLVASFVVSPGLTAIAALFLGTTTLVIAVVAPRVERHGRTILDSSQNVTDVMAQYLSGYKTMKAFNALTPALSEVEREAERRERAQVRVVRLDATMVVVPEALLIFALIGLVAVSRSADQGIAELGVVMALLFRVSQRAKAMRQIATLGEYFPLIRLVQKTEREFAVHARPDDGRQQEASFTDAIEFEDVEFAYAGDRVAPALQGVTFRIEPGDVIGVVGSSGAGKSTLSALLLGLLDPTAGRIALDGTDLRELRLESWLDRIGYVPQESFLLNGTIGDNIRFFRDVEDGAVRRAAGMANIDALIDSLPQGYDTPVGENGVELSGGERQRVCLARALVGDPELLVLDEATSSLDGASERSVQEAIAGVRGQTTIVMIAHRLSTVADADRLLVLDGGNLVESGSPAELLARPGGAYRRMHELQQAGDDAR